MRQQRLWQSTMDGNWTSYINGGFNGNIIYKWRVFHCHVSLPEGSLYIIGCQIESDTITLHHVVANWSQSKIAETVVNRHHDFVEKWTLNLAVGGIYNAVPLTKDRNAISPVAEKTWCAEAPLPSCGWSCDRATWGSIGRCCGSRRQHPLGIRLSLEKLRPNVWFWVQQQPSKLKMFIHFL